MTDTEDTTRNEHISRPGPLRTTNYLYDGLRDIEEVDGSGTVLVQYAQSKRVDEPLSEMRQSTTSYYEQDGLGSVTSLSNSSGALANTYDSFGNLTASTSTLAWCPHVARSAMCGYGAWTEGRLIQHNSSTFLLSLVRSLDGHRGRVGRIFPVNPETPIPPNRANAPVSRVETCGSQLSSRV